MQVRHSWGSQRATSMLRDGTDLKAGASRAPGPPLNTAATFATSCSSGAKKYLLPGSWTDRRSTRRAGTSSSKQWHANSAKSVVARCSTHGPC